MSKRRRAPSGRRVAPRPIDKKLIGVVHTVSTTQAFTALITATFPCTIVGFRWDLAFDHITGAPDFQWALVIVRDGNVVSTLALSNGADFYTPEQNVLAFGVGFIYADIVPREYSGTTKTMRKLMGGDQIAIISLASVVNSVLLHGVVQFFCKG